MNTVLRVGPVLFYNDNNNNYNNLSGRCRWTQYWELDQYSSTTTTRTTTTTCQDDVDEHSTWSWTSTLLHTTTTTTTTTFYKNNNNNNNNNTTTLPQLQLNYKQLQIIQQSYNNYNKTTTTTSKEKMKVRDLNWWIYHFYRRWCLEPKNHWMIVHSSLNDPFTQQRSTLNINVTRKPCYHKDDHAMRPICECLSCLFTEWD